MKFYIIIILLSLTLFQLQGQNTLKPEILNDLHFYSDVMVHADSELHRLRASGKFIKLFEKTLNEPNSFDYELESIPYISSVVAPDKTFKIYTFNILDGMDVSTDFGFIHHKNGSLFKLTPEKYLDDIEFEELDHTRWVSGLYYHMIPFISKDSIQHYVLLGFSQTSKFNKRKVLDILSWKDGKPIFGKDLFVTTQEGSRDIRMNRRIYNYSADVSMLIQYNSEFNAIVIDHLMEVKSRIPGSYENTRVPDGTYTSYSLKKGEWIYKDKLFEQKDINKLEVKVDEEPKKSIFGN